MDFFQVRERSHQEKAGRPKKKIEGSEQKDDEKNVIEIYPDFVVGCIKDLLVRGRDFYAIWDEDKGMWSTDIYDAQRFVDRELYLYKEGIKDPNVIVKVKSMFSFSTKSWLEFKNYMSHLPDANHNLDERLTFSNTKVKKSDYVSKRLSYPLESGSHSAYDELISTLYDTEERAKLEWAIGAIVSGDSKDIQKFVVLYGSAGAGKSTVLNIIQKLFEGYYTTFEAKALTSSNNSFSTEVFRANPLVAIQHDGDLSRIEDNTKLNSIISHEEMVVNEKFKASYTARFNCFLFMATNKPVKITDAKSGIIRRLIDVKPSGRKLPSDRYFELMSQIDFELGGIAHHCLEVYRNMGKNYYSAYRPLDMMFKTDPFFNFVEDNYDVFKDENGITLSRAYDMYKSYCDNSLVEFKLSKFKFREELKNYFGDFYEMTRIDGKQVRSYYSGFLFDKFGVESGHGVIADQTKPPSLVLDRSESILDDLLADCPAQYASDTEKPTMKWAEVTTKLSDLDTTKLHYVKGPDNHIMIDFDLKDKEGKKSAELNLEAASKWPPTYAEYSKGGSGIHLHYIYEGDVGKLSSVFAEGIEVKVPIGGSSIRRRLSKCNNVPIATINSGLPLKEEKVINFESVRNEKTLRDLLKRNLAKDIHPGTKPSVDFIFKLLDDAYKSGMHYDVTDMRPKILAFANNSTNQADYCIKLVSKMQFKSEEPSLLVNDYKGDELVFFDVEVFPNLFLVNWKVEGPDSKCVRMINPTAAEIEDLLKFKLVGFNCRRYDNHILYARYIGYDNMGLYTLSQRIIDGSPNALFGEAYELSYTDVYDFASAANKKSLKKFEIELGIHHQELGLPWDQPVPEEKWGLVAEYCDNDVVATEATFNHLKADWTARQILAEWSGLSVNATTNMHSTKIIFGNEKKPQSQFVYTDLSEMFPGYEFKNGKSYYRGEDPGEGGYVYANPGMYRNVALLDVASMHPTSIEQLNLFGPYTKTFSDIKSARIAIKHDDKEALGKLLNGRLVPFVERSNSGEFKLSDLSNALKTVINSVYGLTSAKFDNAFRDPRNIDNIVAKRGALFMIDLKHAVQEKGFVVAHIKTDSIKIPDATPEIIEFAMEFGKKYGYVFEHEATYDRLCLVNDAVYIAKYKDGKHAGEWTATGAQFAQPYVFKTLFSKEPLTFEDVCETKTVNSALYLDMNERLPNVSDYEKMLAKLEKETKDESESYIKAAKIDELKDLISRGHDYHFIGKAGLFCPILPECGGGVLLREKDGKYYAATGSKGYRWLEAETVKLLGKELEIDSSYYVSLVDAAKDDISKYGDFEMFISDEEPESEPPPVKEDTPPRVLPCGDNTYDLCLDCPQFSCEGDTSHPTCKLGHDIEHNLNKVWPF